MGGGSQVRESRSARSIGRLLALLRRVVAGLTATSRRRWFAARPAPSGRDTAVVIRVHRPARLDLRPYSVVRC